MNQLLFFSHAISIILLSACIMWLINNALHLKLARYLMSCLVFLIVWLIGQLLEYASENLLQQTIALDMLYLGSLFIGPTFFLFALKYVKPHVDLPAFAKLLLYMPTAILYLLYIIDPAKAFFYVRYDIDVYERTFGFFIAMFVVYSYLIASILLILIESRKAHYKKKLQMWFLIAYVIFPFILNVISLFFLTVDVTPYAFSLSAVLVLVAIYKFEFIDVTPLAMNSIVNSMNDPIIVVDKEGKIAFINLILNVFLKNRDIRYDSLSLTELADRLKKYISSEYHGLMDRICENESFDDPNSYLKTSDGLIFTIKRVRIYDKGLCIGYVIKLNDLTDFLTVMDELKATNEQLEDANKKLINLNTVTEQLAIERERIRIAQHLHDTMGHDLVNMMTLTKLAAMEKDNKSESLNYLLSLSTKLLESLRDYVSNLDSHENINIVNRLQTLIQSMDITQVAIEFSFSGEENDTHLFAGDAILNAVREAVTNSIRHGQANRIYIIVKFLTDAIKVFIMDNGIGCAEINKHMGLSGMVKAIRYLGGQIQFDSNKGEGFSVRISIPVNEVSI